MTSLSARYKPIVLSSDEVWLDQLLGINRHHRSLTLADSRSNKITSGAFEVQKIVAKADANYGINTGFGLAEKNRIIVAARALITECYFYRLVADILPSGVA